MSTAAAGQPAWCPTDPTEAESCPGCGATTGVQRITGTSPKVRAWSCTACRTNWATTVINPALSIIGLLPTPQLRTAALLAALRAEVTQRSAKEHHPVNDTTVCLPATELFNIDGLASVDVVTWHCRICDLEGTAKYRPAASTAAVEHLVDQHRSTINTT